MLYVYVNCDAFGGTVQASTMMSDKKRYALLSRYNLMEMSAKAFPRRLLNANRPRHVHEPS